MNRMGFSSIFFILAIFVRLNEGSHSYLACPHGFERHGSRCYKALNQKASWPEAKVYCAVMGGDLASVRNENDQTVISGIISKNQVSTPDERYWLDGFYDNGWRWMKKDGTSVSVTYTNWAPGQPDMKGEKCMAAYYANNGQWHDHWCDALLNSICFASASSNRLEIMRYQRRRP